MQDRKNLKMLSTFFFSGYDLCCAWNPVCIGTVYGVIGKLKIHPGIIYCMLLIT